jgi:hypothetical protein
MRSSASIRGAGARNLAADKQRCCIARRAIVSGNGWVMLARDDDEHWRASTPTRLHCAA